MDSWSSTCWTAIRGAAEGDPLERERFAQRYAPVARSYLQARWRSMRRDQDIDDALQEVFLECFREGGALEKVSPDRPGGFRAFLYGVTRNVAARIEQRRARKREVVMDSAFGEDQADTDLPEFSQAFDRAWAVSIMRQAWDLQSQRASEKDDRAQRRVDLLKLRFEEALPIRDIATKWAVDPTFRRIAPGFPEAANRRELLSAAGRRMARA